MGQTRFSALATSATAFNDTTGHIAIPKDIGTAVLTKSTAGTDYTLAVPIAGDYKAGGDDGLIVRIFSTSASAHVVTAGAGKINGATNGTLTFATAIGNGVAMQAYNGVWYVISNIGVTVG